MSNNKIVAICADSPYSATTEDGGVNWVQTNADNLRWKSIAGDSTGKYLYTPSDFYNPYAIVNYSTTDVGSTWTSGVLPIKQLECIVAVADDTGGLFTSFDGSTFAKVGPVPDVNYNREFGGNKIYQTCFAHSVSVSKLWTAVNASLFLQTCIATSTSVAANSYLRCKVVVGTAATFTRSTFERMAIYNRTFAASVSSVVTMIKEFIW